MANVANVSNETDDSLNTLVYEQDRAAEGFNKISDSANELASLKNKLLSFFGISGTIQVFRKATRQAYEAISELDKAMTETAVVTDFSVGDMWEQLPAYTK